MRNLITLLSWQRWKIATAILIAAVFLISAFGSYFYFLSSSVSVASDDQTPAFEGGGGTSNEPQPFSIAMLGYGGGGHEGGRLTDSMMVLRIDPSRKKIMLISVPRDLFVPLEVKIGEQSNWKINAAYAIGADDNNYRNKPEKYTGSAGGGNMAKDVLELVLGTPIDRFVAIDFAGFVQAVEVLDGIAVDVQKPFNDPWYPIPGKEDDSCGKSEEEVAATASVAAHIAEREFPCRFEHLQFPAGIVAMDGEEALKFARSRHSPTDGGDFNRAARQRQVILAVKNKVLALGFIPKIIPFITQLATHVVTDLSAEDMRILIEKQAELLEYEIVGIALTTDENNILSFGTSANGQSIVIPKTGQNDWATIHSWLEQQFEQAEEVEDITAFEATTSAKNVQFVISSPPPATLADGKLETFRLKPSSSKIELLSTGEFGEEVFAVYLVDAQGSIVADQSEVTFNWQTSDDTLIDISTSDINQACHPEMTSCRNYRARFKAKKTGQAKVMIEARYKDVSLPILVLEVPVEVEAP